jgi:hypothetical protein
MKTTHGESRRASEKTARTLGSQQCLENCGIDLQFLAFSYVHVVDIARLGIS